MEPGVRGTTWSYSLRLFVAQTVAKMPPPPAAMTPPPLMTRTLLLLVPVRYLLAVWYTYHTPNRRRPVDHRHRTQSQL